MKKIIIGVVALILFILIFIIFKKDSQKNEHVITETQERKEYVSPISIEYLRSLKIDSNELKIEEELDDGGNYKRYIASYLSENNKIFGLLTVPNGPIPKGGFPTIIFNHGYIPPKQYQTTENYVSYVDYLARHGFVVFKIDLRGNGNSEGDATGSYFSSAYTIDAISALKSLQKFKKVNSKKIGMWGHSMAGNLVLRAMLVSPEIKVGVIWAGAVYSYEDFAKYRISDSSYAHRPEVQKKGIQQQDRESSKKIDFNNKFWTSISLTKNIKYLSTPLQFHHAIDDEVVNVGYSRDLVSILKKNSKLHEYYEYNTGGHNLTSPSFEEAMEKTVKFFKKSL